MPLHGLHVRLVAVIFAAAALTACEVRTDPGDGQAQSPVVPVPDDAHEVELIVAEGAEGATLAFVPIFIQGEGPFAFALDTGASTTLIAEDVVDRLGLEVTGDAPPLRGIGGGADARLVEMHDWQLGDDVPLQPKTIVTSTLPSDEFQGLLGSDILSNFGVITVDYDAGTLHLQPRQDGGD
jgi:predicted aspartyl protease